LGWDDARGATVSQRSKEHAHDYRYFPEPDLPPVEVSRAWVNEIKERLPELPDAKTRRFMDQYGLKRQEAILLTSDKSLANYFEDAAAKSKSPAKTIHSWIRYSDRHGHR